MHLEFRPDGQPFNMTNLTITFQIDGTNVNWWPGQLNARNLGGAATTLDGVAKPFLLPDGLLSQDGWYLLDDSRSAILTNDWITQRPYVLPPVRRPSNKPQPPSDIDWYFFAYGTDYKEALKTLGAISGQAAMPRKEVLGSWYCRWYPYSADEFHQIVNEYREHDFPLDILVMDMDWHTQDARTGYGHAGNLGWTGYTWNRKLIPDPEKLLKEFKGDNLFITLNDHPADGIRDHEEGYDEFMKLLPPGTPANPPFDAGDSNYINAFFKASHAPLERQGVDFWWLDWQQDYIYPYVYGIPGLQYLPWLNYLYFQHSQQNGKRGQIYSRWGGWGEQRYPIHFSGDARACWEMLRFEIPFTTSSGNAGCFFWAHDTGGFSGDRDSETYARWVQFSTFSTSLRLHSVGESLDRRPWLWGQPFEDSMRRMFHLRAQLFPYIYSSVRECYDQMLPLLRPMYLEYPTQQEAYQHPGQYLFGDNFLVAPVTAPGNGTNYLAQQTVWFPPGQWFNFLNGEKYEGGRIATVSAGIDEIPVYVRAGVPIPMQPYTSRMTTTPLTNLIVRCFPGPPGESILYEDDGQSQGYLTGEFATTRISSKNIGGTIHIHIAPAQGQFKGQPQKRAYQIELPTTKKMREATVNSLPANVSYDEKLSMNIITINPCSIDQAIDVEATVAPINPK